MKKLLLLFTLAPCIAFGQSLELSVISQNRYSEDEVAWDNGKPVLKSDMKPDNGVVYSKYDNGQLRDEISWKDGKYDGTVKRRYENGQLGFEGTFKAGHPVGLCRGWYDNGQLKFVTEEKAGKRYNKRWYNTGKLQKEYINKNHVLISQKEWDEEGNLTKEEKYQSPNIILSSSEVRL